MNERKPRILVVDDEPQLTRVLLRSLTTKGYDGRIAGDGDFALQTFHDWPAELVITDLAMPNMSGLELSGVCGRSHRFPLLFCPSGREQRSRSLTPARTITSPNPSAWTNCWRIAACDVSRRRIQTRAFLRPASEIDPTRTATQGGQELRQRQKFELMTQIVRNATRFLTHHSLSVRFGAATTPSRLSIYASSSAS